MTARFFFRFAAALACIATATSARAQTATDSRWAAWTGCWQPAVQLRAPGPSAGIVCVTPTTGSSIEIAMVDSGRVIARDTIDASGAQRPFASQGCTGWRRGSWSKDGRRMYLRSELGCAGGQTRTATSMFAIAESGDWIHVEGAAAAGNSGVRVVRYLPAGSWVAPELPSELGATLRVGAGSPNDARMLAGTPIAAADVIEASKQLDTAVVQAWLMERGQPFELDGRKIVALADAGVPGSVIDVMVGVSFPERFVFAPRGSMRDTSAEARTTAPRGGVGPAYGRMSCSTMWDPTWYPGAYDPCAARYGYSYGYGGYYGAYGYGGYPYGYSPYYGGYGYAPTIGIGGGFYPTTVVVVEKRELPHGRVVNGEGYTRGGSNSDRGTSGSDHAAAAPSSPPPRQSTAGSSSGSSGSSSSGSSSSSGRTAHKKGG